MLAAIVLAAGKGTRMKSNIPKVLHKAAGKTLIEHVCDALSEAEVKEIVIVVGYGAQEVMNHLGSKYKYALQEQQLGTGHAVLQAQGCLDAAVDTVLVVCGDTPLLTGDTFKRLLKQHLENKAAATVLTAVLPNAQGYGRIIRNDCGTLIKIVEEKDAEEVQRAIKEINTGTYCFQKEALFAALKKISPQNSQGEYYLTDVIESLAKDYLRVETLVTEDYRETEGINNRVQLSEAEKLLRRKINERHMLSGVTIVDPEVTYIDASVTIGMDTVIYPFSFLQGDTHVGEGCRIGPHCTLEDTFVGNSVTMDRIVAKGATIGSNCTLGPFSYLRPGTELAEGVKVGDFVEIKKSIVGPGSKIPHLSYVGDCTIGEEVNVGAGTITCNYDGKNKWQTVLEDGAFIGSNTNLVAPVRVGKNAVTGAGSTITEDVPPDSLALGRQRQTNILGWVNRQKDKEKE
ncbi:MAG: bifunctional UDP-N-acetylglucosamine diphosphorylase/glucosamine-1-phosphate N-acetyltransferase GlmU [Bacillota bacterium]